MTLCRPKKCGGANLRMAKDMNQAMLAKLAWHVLTCSGELWREVLCAKYKVKIEDGAHFAYKQGSSQIWRGVCWGAELMRKGLRWPACH